MDNELSSFGDWELKQRLGAGGYGEVLLWKHRRSNQEIATKRCLRDRDQMHDDEIAKLKERWLQEHRWMLDVKTDFIVRGIELNDADFVSYLNHQHGAWRPLPVIIMEYCNGGDVRQQLLKISNCNGLPEFEVRQIMLALRHAVEYLHSICKIEHRDLKPDNIVINCTGREKIYKLTDFGFSCKVLDQTTQASIVGTSNYIAPEILDTSQYTKTVDYWSLGIIAFELMCGQLPFVPHQSIYNKITNIRAKPATCIAITENPKELLQFKFESKVFAENHLSSAFQLKMEKWLRLALNTNFRLRGSETSNQPPSHELKIFTMLDEIMESKILTIFCLNTFKYYSYDLSENMTMAELLEAWERDTHIARNTYFVILPTGHPHMKLTAQTKPIDLFVPAWMDASAESGNPAAMLYLLSYKGEFTSPQPQIPSMIQHCLELANTVGKNVPPAWVLQQIAVQTHFLLSNEQRLLEAFLGGLHEYALTIEHEIFVFEPTVTEMTGKIIFAAGCVRQFNTMVQQAQLACELKASPNIEFFREWESKLCALNDKMQKIQMLDVRKRYNSALKRIQKQAVGSYFKELQTKDIYQLSTFRQRITEWQRYPQTCNVLTLCRDTVYACIEQRNKFHTSQLLIELRSDISAIHEEFIMISKISAEAQSYLQNFEAHLMTETAAFQQQLLESYAVSRSLQVDCSKLQQQMNQLTMSTDAKAALVNSSNTGAVSLDDILELPPTNQLLLDSWQQMSLLEMVYDDEPSAAIPVTVHME